MTWDEHRVRIELGDGMSLVSTPGRNDLKARQCAEIWPFVDGKVKGRKPAARIVADTRAQLLRDLADWMEQNDDPGLTGIIEQMPA